MKKLIIKDKIKIERGIDELKRGRIIAVSHKGDIGLILSAELLLCFGNDFDDVQKEFDKKISEQLSEQGLGLDKYIVEVIVTSERLNYLQNNVNQGNNSVDKDVYVYGKLTANKLTKKELSELAFREVGSNLEYNYKKIEEKICGLEYRSLQLMKFLELVPVILFVNVENKIELLKLVERNIIMMIDLEQFLFYRESQYYDIECLASACVPLKYNENVIIKYFKSNNVVGKEYLSILVNDPVAEEVPLLRIHSACFTGDLLGSLLCDCGSQLHNSLKLISDSDKGGMIIYLMQEGRGIGLLNKLRTYRLQSEHGFDTVEANEILGFIPDERDYTVVANILKYLSIKKVTLISNNLEKKKQLVKHGITVDSVQKITSEINKYNKKYLQTKKNKFNHNIGFDE